MFMLFPFVWININWASVFRPVSSYQPVTTTTTDTGVFQRVQEVLGNEDLPESERIAHAREICARAR